MSGCHVLHREAVAQEGERELPARFQVFPFQCGILLQHLLLRRTGHEEFQDGLRGNAHAPNHRLPVADPVVHGNPFEQFRVGVHVSKGKR